MVLVGEFAGLLKFSFGNGYMIKTRMRQGLTDS